MEPVSAYPYDRPDESPSVISYRGPTDFRKGFDGLCGLVRQDLGRYPADGAVYLFINRKRDRMKLLVWEPGGFMMYYKRLELKGILSHDVRQEFKPVSSGSDLDRTLKS